MNHLAQSNNLLTDLRRMIDDARAHVAQTANSTLTMLHWEVGQRIRTEVLGEARASYGEQIVASLSQQLLPLYGRGFTGTALTRIIAFAQSDIP